MILFTDIKYLQEIKILPNYLFIVFYKFSARINNLIIDTDIFSLITKTFEIREM